MSLFRIGFSGLLSLTIFPVCVTSIYADSATMGASKDTTIQSDNVNRSNGRGPIFLCRQNGRGRSSTGTHTLPR